MTIKISQLANVSAVTGNVILPLVANVSGTLTTVKGNVDQLKTYVLGTLETDVATLTANAGVQAGALATLTGNAAVQSGVLATLQADVVTLTSNAAAQAGTLATLTSNAATQSDAIASITNGTATFGNIVPSANVTYNLGSPTAQWKDLYLSGSTIYIGGATLSVSGGEVQSSLPIAADITANTLSVADTQITFSQGSYIDETEVVGMPGTYGLALNSPEDGIVGLNAIDSNAAVMSSVIASNVAVQVNVANITYGGNPLVWFYDQSGSIQWPDETIQATAFSQGYVDLIVDAGSNIAELQSNVATLNSNGANIFADIDTLQNNVAFTMSNIAHWTSNVYTINDALNQLAQRIYNIENP
jgi:peptidoglycan hydrolase CwlO-like protein